MWCSCTALVSGDAARWLFIMLLAELGSAPKRCPLAAGAGSCAVCIRQRGCASGLLQFTPTCRLSHL